MVLSLNKLAPTLFFVIVVSLASPSANAQTPFTYQGHLSNNSTPANGMFTMKFRLYDAMTGGSPIGGEITRSVGVANAIFTVDLDFGANVFASGERYLEIEVGGTTLLPRQKVNYAPLAARSISADSLSANCDGCITSEKLATGSGINLKSIAAQRWYEANQTTGNAAYYIPCSGLTALKFDGNFLWYGGTCGSLIKINPYDFNTSAGNGGAGTILDMVSDGTFMWTVNGSGTIARFALNNNSFVSSFSTPGFNARGIIFDGANLWVANFSSNNVSKLPLGANNVPGPATLISTGPNPQWMAFDGTNVWISNTNPDGTGNSWITKINAANNTTTNIALPAGVPARGLAFDGRHIWAALFNGNIAKIRVADSAIVGTYPAGADPQGVVFDGVNIWVANRQSHTVTKLRANTGSPVGSYSSGGIFPVALSFDGTNVWVGNQGDGKLKKL